MADKLITQTTPIEADCKQIRIDYVGGLCVAVECYFDIRSTDVDAPLIRKQVVVTRAQLSPTLQTNLDALATKAVQAAVAKFGF